jgi:hypothetical protein
MVCSHHLVPPEFDRWHLVHSPLEHYCWEVLHFVSSPHCFVPAEVLEAQIQHPWDVQLETMLVEMLGLRLEKMLVGALGVL